MIITDAFIGDPLESFHKPNKLPNEGANKQQHLSCEISQSLSPYDKAKIVETQINRTLSTIKSMMPESKHDNLVPVEAYKISDFLDTLAQNVFVAREWEEREYKNHKDEDEFESQSEEDAFYREQLNKHIEERKAEYFLNRSVNKCKYCGESGHYSTTCKKKKMIDQVSSQYWQFQFEIEQKQHEK